MGDLIDIDGFRANVGIVLCNDRQELFWAGRAGRRGWQFPQGGIGEDETPEAAMYRELEEEIGLHADHVELIGSTEGWLRYRLPRRFQRRRNGSPRCVGQKQRYFLLRLVGSEEAVRFDATGDPEFDRWCWVDYWYPVREVIYFKRRVYESALEQFGAMLFPEGPPPRDERVRRRSAVRSR